MEELFIPATGMAMEDAELIEWLRQPGDAVAAGDAVALIETDKATVDIVAETDGIMGPHLCSPGDRVTAGATIGHVVGADHAGVEPVGEPEPAAMSQEAPADQTVPQQAASVTHAVETTEVSGVPARTAQPSADPMDHPWDGERRPHGLTPRARSGQAVPEPAPVAAAAPVAVELAPAAPAPVEHAAVAPTPRQAPAPQAERSGSVDDARQTRAEAALVRAVTDSWRNVPHFTVAREIDVTGFLAYREYLRSLGSAANMTDIILQATQRAWRTMRPEALDGVGLAVATPRRVINVSVPDAATPDIEDLARRRHAAVERARNGMLRPADYSSVEVTVSNLGSRGVDAFTGIIPPGQLALLTIGRVSDRLELDDNGTVRVRKVMWVCANLDHRTLDGAHGADLLEAFQAAGQIRLQDPSEGS